MRLNAEWRRIMRKAWSIRFIALAWFLTGLEMIFQICGVDWMPGPLWFHLIVIMVVMGAAFVARIVVQRDFK
jgi:hypothetical protein